MKTLLIIILYACFIFPQEGLIKDYFKNGNLKSEINFSNNIREGTAKFYFENGNLKEELNYANGKVEGLVKVYYKNGKLSETYNIEDGKREGPTSRFDSSGVYLADVNFENGELVKEKEVPVETGKTQVAANNEEKRIEKTRQQLKKKSDDLPIPPKIDEMKMQDDPAIFKTAELMPVPVGGSDAIQRKLIYPAEAKEKGIEGIVKISADINKNGDVTKVDVAQGLGYGCDEAAKIAVYYTKFKPALLKGEPVNVQMIIPVVFKLNNK